MADAVQIRIAFKPALDGMADMFKNFRAESPLRDEINKILLRIQSYSKQLTPVDTGRLRASETTSMLVNQIGGMVSTDVNYAIYVHEGTRKMKARPFMEAAANLVEPSMGGIISSRLEEEFTKNFKRL